VPGAVNSRRVRGPLLLILGVFLVAAAGIALLPCVRCPDRNHWIRYWTPRQEKFQEPCATCRQTDLPEKCRTTLLRCGTYKLGVRLSRRGG